jgi:hypothetical protein
VNSQTLSCEAGYRAHNLRLLPRLTPLVLACGITCIFMASPLPAQEKPDKRSSDKGSQGVGRYFNAEATAKDVGLPIDPGARPHKDKQDDRTSAKFGLWGSALAFKLAVVKLESHDSPQKIAAFYKKALTKYGTVLDCSAAAYESKDNDDGKSSNQLTCEDDKPDPGQMTFKAGTNEKQHVGGIAPNGTGSTFQLV